MSHPQTMTCDCGAQNLLDPKSNHPQFCPCGRPLLQGSAGKLEGASETPIYVEPLTPSQALMERLLDPLVIQRLLGLGGVLTVLGVVTWLASLGVFDDVYLLASLMGIANLALFSLGWYLAGRTEHRTAGLAISLLACALAPLHLWFYHAQDILRLDESLWIGGVVCCLFYVATLYQVRSPLFVYAIELGVVLTAGLLLADLGYLDHITWVSISLLVSAAVSIHLERVLSPSELSTFTRQTYGKPLVIAGHLQLAAAVILLVISQTAGFLVTKSGMWLGIQWLNALLVSEPMVAAGVWLAAGYLYLYSHEVLGWGRLSGYAGVLCVFMAPATLLGSILPPEFVIALLAIVTACMTFMPAENELRERRDFAIWTLTSCSSVGMIWIYLVAHKVVPTLFFSEAEPGVTLLATLGVMVMAHGVTMIQLLRQGERRMAIFAMALATSLVLTVSVGLSVIDTRDNTTHLTVTIWAIAGLTSVLGVWLPLLERQRIDYDKNLSEAAVPSHTLALQQAIQGVMVPGKVLAIFAAILAVAHVGHPRGDLVTVLPLLSAVVMFEVARRLGQQAYGIASALSASVAALVVLIHFEAGESVYVGSILFTGWLLLTIGWRQQRRQDPGRGSLTVAQTVGHLILGLAMVAIAMLGIGRVLTGSQQLQHLTPLALAAFASFAAMPVVGGNARRPYVGAAVLQFLLGVAMGYQLLDLSIWDATKYGLMALGSLLLIVGFVGYLKEPEEGQKGEVTAALWSGAVLLVSPLLAATVFYRLDTGVSLFDELGLVTVTVALLVLGLMCQLKSTTLVGAVGLSAEFCVLALNIFYRSNLAIGVYLAAGGAVIFLAALALSVYRDRLLELPTRVAGRKGIFRIIDWR